MFNLTPLTRENTPFPTSANILARYAEDGVSHAKLIVYYPDRDDDDAREYRTRFDHQIIPLEQLTTDITHGIIGLDGHDPQRT